MKHAPTSCSRSELLVWINSHVERNIGAVKRIEELGSGAAYLFLLSSLRPGAVRSEKIIRHPANHHEFLHNLRLLAATLDKLDLPFKLEVRPPALRWRRSP